MSDEKDQVQDHQKAKYYGDIYNIGEIQNIGYVIAVNFESPSKIRIISVSDNIFKSSIKWTIVQQKTVENILNKNIFDIMDNCIANNIKKCIEGLQNKSFNAITREKLIKKFTVLNANILNEQNIEKNLKYLLCCSIIACSNADTFILEIEEIESSVTIPNSYVLQSGSVVNNIETADSIEKVTAAFLDAVMEMIPGYDRGMVYRFKDDLSGEVTYENIANPQLIKSSYLHLRFPAGDIPPVYRALYIKNIVRILYDVDGINSKVISTESDTLDLSMCGLRSMSPCHLQYLRNMGVVSSLCVSIVINGKLWGMYVLHSYKETIKPNLEQRVAMTMIASISSIRIEGYERDTTNERKLSINRIVSNIETCKTLYVFLNMYYMEILTVLDAHCLVIYEGDDGGKIVYGDSTITPTQEGFAKLLKIAKDNVILAMSNFYEDLEGDGAGLMFFRNQYVTIAVIRKNMTFDVQWAGKPDEPKDAAFTLQPRSSFEAYMVQAAKESKGWREADQEVAQCLFNKLTHYHHTEMLDTFRLSLNQSNSECLQAMESAKEHYEFFAHMSHELRTPFHGVMSSLQILKASGSLAAPDRDEIVDAALECGKTMLRTLDDILTIAKSRNVMEFIKNPFAISKLLTSIRRMMGPIANSKQVEFNCSVGDLFIGSVPLKQSDWLSLVVSGDETRMTQIANNLTNNAIKFTPTGKSVSIRVHLLSLDNVDQMWSNIAKRYPNQHFICIDATKKRLIDGEDLEVSNEVWYVLEVEDTGCGITFEDMKVMFNPYKQVSSGVSKTYQGTGLGLHICRLHVELMGGLLGVSSNPGVGTLFMVAIPFDIINMNGIIKEEKVSRKRPLELLDSNIDLAAHDAIFMLVDDSNVNLRLTKRKLLIAFGNLITESNIKFAVDGLEAIEQYENYLKNGKNNNVAVILMDYHMPKCNGLDAIIKIRQLESVYEVNRPVHIIALTADVSETSKRELLGRGANAILAKPTPTGLLEEMCAARFCQSSNNISDVK